MKESDLAISTLLISISNSSFFVLIFHFKKKNSYCQDQYIKVLKAKCEAKRQDLEVVSSEMGSAHQNG